VSALAIDASSPAIAFVEQATGGDAVTASFTAPSGSLLVALVDPRMVTGGTTTGPTVADSGGLTWVAIGHFSNPSGNANHEAWAWYAITTSAVSRTVTCHCTVDNTHSKYLQVVVVTGVDVSSPIGNTDVFGSATNTLLNRSVTAKRIGELAMVIYSDWLVGVVPTAAAGTTLYSGQRAAGGVGVTGATLYTTTPAASVGATLTVATTTPTPRLSAVTFGILPAPVPLVQRLPVASQVAGWL